MYEKITFFPLTLIVFIVESSYSLSHLDIFVSGPGLYPEEIVLPARFFSISSRTNEQIDETLLNVEISGLNSHKSHCRIWKQVLNRRNGSFLVRYRLYETCYDLKINVIYDSLSLEGFPLVAKGPVLTEECDCPNQNIEDWFDKFRCKGIHKQINKDLQRFPRVDFNKFHERVTRRFNKSMSSSVCHYVVKSNKVYRDCYGEHVGFKIFMDVILLSLTRKVVFPDFEFYSNLGDWPLVPIDDPDIFPLFSWCKTDEMADILMPTYEITHSTLEAMGTVSVDMLSVQGNIERAWKDKENKAFWRGRDSSQERLKLIEIARNNPDLINASLTNFFFYRDQEAKYGPKVPHESFFKFFDYKFQLNLDGTVAAYRFPFLLAGDALIFKQDSKYFEHFYIDIQPWKHFIPVKSDLSNLVSLLKWALENDDKAHEIANAGQKYARENLMAQEIFCYHAHLFYEWSKRLENDVVVREGMELVEQKNSDKSCKCIALKNQKDEL